MVIDNILKNNLITDVEDILQIHLTEEKAKQLARCFETTIGTHNMDRWNDINDKKKHIRDRVYSFKTKYKEGFTNSEIDTLLEEYPEVNRDRFNDSLIGNAYMEKGGEMVIYHIDVVIALRYGMGKKRH